MNNMNIYRRELCFGGSGTKPLCRFEKWSLFRSLLLAVCAAFSALSFGCSSVFSGTISGQVQELVNGSDIGVGGVEVYAFVKEKDRNSAVQSGARPSPSEKIFYAKTDSDGSYHMAITWESFFSEFGKTADRIPVYLAFYHKDFGDGKPVAASSVSYLTSDLSSVMLTERLVRTRDLYTLGFDVRNVARTSNVEISPALFSVKVTGADGSEVYFEGTPQGNSVTFSAPAGGVSGYVDFVPNDTGLYALCRSDGTYGSAEDYRAGFTLADKNARNNASPVYVKYLRLDSVLVSGTVGSDNSSLNNGWTVSLLAPDGSTVAVANSAPYAVTDSFQRQGYFSFSTPVSVLTAESYGTEKDCSVEYTVRAEKDGQAARTGTVRVHANPQLTTDSLVLD